MKDDDIMVVKDLGFVRLLVDRKRRTYLAWFLTDNQKRFYGKNISFVNCYRRCNLCERNLKRPHLTCLTCKVRKVVMGKLPLLFQIEIHQVWSYPAKSTFQKLLFKNSLSLTESLS